MNDKSWDDLRITMDDIWKALFQMVVDKGLSEEEAKSVLEECREEFLDLCNKVPGGLPEDFATMRKTKTWGDGILFFDLLREAFNNTLKKRIM